jgi:hypothetical protein
MSRISLLVILLFAFSSNVILLSQSVDTKFGKNRVQYHKDFEFWDKYESRNFIVYWYGTNRTLAKAAIQTAEIDHDDVRRLIEHKINDKIEIIVYTDLADLKQTNIGSEDAFYNKPGETKIAGNKMYIHFNGNHLDLRRNIREGIASVYLGSLLLGSNFQEILQNTIMLDLPQWFTEGLISYAGDSWNLLRQDELRDILARDEKMWSYKNIADKYPRIAGHSFWHYLSQQYGKSTISNVIYLTKISHDLKSSFQFVLNIPYSTIIEDWTAFYEEVYNKEKGKFTPLSNRNQLDVKNKKYNPVSLLSFNPTGDKLVYTTNQLGKLRIYLKDLKSNKVTLIYKEGFKNAFQETDYQYPSLCWNPRGDELTFTVIDKGDIYLRKYNLRTNKTIKQKLPNPFQRIYSISYLDNLHYIFTAATEGISDLFQYSTKNREFLSITQDFYDDLDATYTTYNDEKGILFSSNRAQEHIIPSKLDSILPISNFDIFFLPFDGAKDQFEIGKISKTLVRITNTDFDNERWPMSVDSGKFVTYIGGKSGINNLYVSDFGAENPYPVTNLPRNMIRYSATEDGDKVAYTLYDEGKYKVFMESNIIAKPTSIYIPRNDQSDNSNNENGEADQKINQLKKYTFVSKFPDPPYVKPLNTENPNPLFVIKSKVNNANAPVAKPIEFNTARITASGSQFKFFNVGARLDNEVLFEGLELFGGQNPQVNQIPMGLLAKASVSDLFENHKLEGGLRIPTSFNGSEFFLTYDNNKHLIDKRMALYRRVTTEAPNENENPFYNHKKETILGLYQLKYPFNIFSSVKVIGSLRFDRNYQKALDTPSFGSEVNRDKRVGLRLEYVYDNTFDYDINVLHGTRAKVFVESFNQFDLNVVDGFDFNFSPRFTNVIGLDARHYIPVLGFSVLALRASSAISFGQKPNLYYLGGVNNSLFNTFDQSTPVPDRDFAFKANANNLRGFNVNVRNGTSFGLLNAELRIPVFKYILGKNRGVSFFRNFQIVGFADAGLAWYGWNPVSTDNPINTERIIGPQITLDVKYFRDPLVSSYGGGVRTMLFGYFVRVDYALGIESRIIQNKKLHLSVGLDF